MRIVRFLDPEGRVRFGHDYGDGSAGIVVDPQGVLGPSHSGGRRAMFKGRRAVVADDDPNMRELMTTVLRSAGAICTTCEDGAEAIAAIEHDPPDLVVSDIVMPHHTGYEIFEAARRVKADMPIVLVTGFGYDPSHTLVRAAKEGLETVLYKPFRPRALLEELARAIRAVTPTPMAALRLTEEREPIRQRLAPLDPTNIVCIGRNYPTPGQNGSPSPIDELEVFLKPTSSACGMGAPIVAPGVNGQSDLCLACEGELAVIIGRRIRDATREDVMSSVVGVTIANDVTARRWQTASGPPLWMRGKGFDSFCPLGPAIVPIEDVATDAAVRTIVNDQVVREAPLSDMIRDVPQILADLSTGMTLVPGTVVLTGAPPALEENEPVLQAGDAVTIEIEGIGRLDNPVLAGAGRSTPAPSTG